MPLHGHALTPPAKRRTPATHQPHRGQKSPTRPPSEETKEVSRCRPGRPVLVSGTRPASGCPHVGGKTTVSQRKRTVRRNPSVGRTPPPSPRQASALLWVMTGRSQLGTNDNAHALHHAGPAHAHGAVPIRGPVPTTRHAPLQPARALPPSDFARRGARRAVR